MQRFARTVAIYLVRQFWTRHLGSNGYKSAKVGQKSWIYRCTSNVELSTYNVASLAAGRFGRFAAAVFYASTKTRLNSKQNRSVKIRVCCAFDPESWL